MKAFIPLFLLLIALYGLGSSIIPLLFAGIAALICDPYIQWLKTKGIKKPYSTILIIVGCFLPLIILNIVLVPLILREAKEFLAVLPDNTSKLLDQIENWAVSIGVSLDYERKDVLELVQTHISKLSLSMLKSVTEVLKQSAGNVTQVILMVLNIFLIPIFFFYMVSERNYWVSIVKTLIPNEYNKRVLTTAKNSISILKSYLQGQVLACLILSVFYAIGLSIVGLRFGVFIGIITGSLTFVPYVGFSIGMGLGLIVAMTAGTGMIHVLLVLLVFMIGQALESFVVTPRFVGKNVGLTALESILVLIIFGNYFGFAGMLVAIPTGAIIKTTLAEYVASH